MSKSILEALMGAFGFNFGAPAVFGKRGVPSPAQQRRAEKWAAGSAERARIAADIGAWNAGIKRRNQRFVARQLARGRSAA